MIYGQYDYAHPRILKSEIPNMLIGLVFLILAIIGIISLIPKRTPDKILSPIPEAGQSGQLKEFTPTPTMYLFTPTPTASPTPPQRPTRGKASYYSIEGCIGCNPARTMANGQRLDDTRLTIAYNHAPLNSMVKVKNVDNGKYIYAKITDRGGFERHGKIADLSVATRDALGCGDTCPIELVW
jgi:rare lipoprotein A (peptidoglycan hydrolase)